MQVRWPEDRGAALGRSTFQPSLNRAFIENLATLAFIDSHDDLLITGRSGTGKSHILQSLTLRACEREIRVRYTRCVDLIDDLYAGLADQTYDFG